MGKKIPAKLKKGLRRAGLAGAGILTGSGALLVIFYLFPDEPPMLNVLRWMETALIFASAYCLQVVLHETGHMLAALLRGWKFVSFMAFGLLLSKDNGKWHFSRNGIPGVAGQSLMMPPEKWDSLGGLLFYNAGGLLMNGLVALAALVLLFFLPATSLFEWKVLLAGLMLSGIFILLTNGIPMEKKGIPNDATNMVALKKDPFSVIAFQKLLLYNAWMSQGKSLEEIAPDYFFAGRQPDLGNTIHVSLLYFDLSLAMARMDFEKAQEIIREVRCQGYKLFPMMRNEFRFEEIFLDLVEGGYGPGYGVRPSMLSYLQKNAKTRPGALRTQYALAKFRDHDENLAEEIYRKFNGLCGKYSPSGEIDAERRLMEYARNKPVSEDGLHRNLPESASPSLPA